MREDRPWTVVAVAAAGTAVSPDTPDSALLFEELTAGLIVATPRSRDADRDRDFPMSDIFARETAESS
jgi:hypothetical protein